MKRKCSGKRFDSGVFALGFSHYALCAMLYALCAMLFAPAADAADKLLVKDTGGNTKFVVTDTGQVAIGTGTPGQDVDIVAPNNGLIRLSSTENDNATKAARLLLRHYSNAQLPVYLFGSAATPANNFVAFGGGSSLGNAATQLDFYTASTTTTPTGTSRITIKGSGNVGIGTTSPTHLIHLSGGAYSDGATWVDASSRELKENVTTLTPSEAMAALTGLTPVTFNYKTDKDDSHVGFIAEDVPDLVASRDRKGLSSMDIVAVLTKVVQEQQRKIADLSEQLNTLQREVRYKSDVASALVK